MLRHWFVQSNKHILVRPGDGITCVISPAQPILVRPGETNCIPIQPGSHTTTQLVGSCCIVVSPQPRGVWDEKGWQVRKSNGLLTYWGNYQINDRLTSRQHRYPGRILVNRTEIIPFIANPPTAIKYHPKAACFILDQVPWFRVHWHHPANNVDDAILYIEKILTECVQ